VLRVGALATYALDDQFQECEDVWVDGTPLPNARPAFRSCRPSFRVRWPQRTR
jgi:hypothetical protein